MKVVWRSVRTMTLEQSVTRCGMPEMLVWSAGNSDLRILVQSVFALIMHIILG